MPAIPYLVLIGVGIVLSFVMTFPMIRLEHVPFQLALPLPQIGGFNGLPTIILIAKMLGFSLMLGVIDVIEQVMSNVAIEKLDPLKRRCDSNNSLLAIWIANLGSTFFGGMTNLDGLAKSTTKRLRFEVSNEGGATATGTTYRLEVSMADPISCAAATYTRVDSSGDWTKIGRAHV